MKTKLTGGESGRGKEERKRKNLTGERGKKCPVDRSSYWSAKCSASKLKYSLQVKKVKCKVKILTTG